MPEISSGACVLGGFCLLYYVRALVRLYRKQSSLTTSVGLWQVVRDNAFDRRILREAGRCALVSTGAFLGIEIASGATNQDTRSDN